VHLRVDDNSRLPFLEVRAVRAELRDVVGVRNPILAVLDE
jgi:hypothetical protein